MTKTIFALSLCMFACGTSLPNEIAIDPTFNPMQRAVIEDTLDHWCQAVEWCPRIVERSEHRIIADSGPFARPIGYPEHWTLLAYNDYNSVHIDMMLLQVVDDPALFWRVVAHELGHYATQDHTDRGLMGGQVNTHMDMCLDTSAVVHWCKHQSCPPLAQTTCIQEPTQPE